MRASQSLERHRIIEAMYEKDLLSKRQSNRETLLQLAALQTRLNSISAQFAAAKVNCSSRHQHPQLPRRMHPLSWTRIMLARKRRYRPPYQSARTIHLSQAPLLQMPGSCFDCILSFLLPTVVVDKEAEARKGLTCSSYELSRRSVSHASQANAAGLMLVCAHLCQYLTHRSSEWACIRLSEFSRLNHAEVDDKFIEAITLRYGAAITCLDLSSCRRISGRSLRILFLHRLHLSKCWQLSAGALAEMFEHFQRLKILDLSGITGLGKKEEEMEMLLLVLGEKCKSLLRLDLAFTDCRDSALRPLSTIQSLQQLSVAACGNITDKGLELLMQPQPHAASSPTALFKSATPALTFSDISLFGCRALTDRGVAAITRNSGNKLRFLDISLCFFLTGSLARQLVTHCTGLKELRIPGCPLLQQELGVQEQEQEQGQYPDGRVNRRRKLVVRDCRIEESLLLEGF